MAHADLSVATLRALVPPDAVRAVRDGQEVWALTLLARARDLQVPDSVEWAVLERLRGLVLIHVQREVEGTFALERADARLDGAGLLRPDLTWLDSKGLDSKGLDSAWLDGDGRGSPLESP